MIFPIRTDRRLQHLPWVNFLLIAVNVVVFLLQLRAQMHGKSPAEQWTTTYQLNPLQPQWYQFLTYQFLHASWEHIGFNMLFLYVFGNHLEDRFGPIGYLLFYLGGGVVAGLGHSYFESSPVIGASGAISAVAGAYLALFPASRVTLAVWLIFFFDVFEIPSILLILLSLGQDLFFQLIDTSFPGGSIVGHVAYLAHITGNIYGFAIGMLLLATHVLPREPFDFIALIDRWNRRRTMRTLVASGQSPWIGDAAKGMADRQLTDRQQAIADLRAQTMLALDAQKPLDAVKQYSRLLQIDPQQVLPRQNQLDLANIAMDDGQYGVAAQAYEAFLRAFPEDVTADQLRLILGLIYARYLQDSDRARPLLTLAAERLTDPARKQLANEILTEIGS